MTPQERLASELASALWNISTLRHGMFTPPEFRQICEEVMLRRLNHEHQTTRSLEIGEAIQEGDLLHEALCLDLWRPIEHLKPNANHTAQAAGYYRRPIQP